MVFQQKLLGKAYFNFKMTGSAMVWPADSVFGKCPMIAPTPIPFQNFHFNLFQPVKMNQGDLKQMVLQLYQPLCEIRKYQL